MKLLLCAAFVFAFGADAGRAQKFDYYVFTLSWSPEFCHENPSNPTPECSPGAKGGFVAHGLWPNRNDGSDPTNCPAQPFNPSAVPQGFEAVMPGGIWRHEWMKHGVCTGMSESDYFGKIAALYRQIAIPIHNTGGDQQISPAALREQFARANPAWPIGSFAIQDNGRYLVAVKICLGRTLLPMACPRPGDTRTTPIVIRGGV